MKPPAMMKVGMASSTMVLMPLKPTGKGATQHGIHVNRTCAKGKGNGDAQ